MKVLWFCNTPALAEEYFIQESKGTGGWLKSLDKLLQNEVDLSVAFLYPYKKHPFKYKNSMYYPIYTGNIIFENLKKKWFGKVHDTDLLTNYLNVIDELKPDIIHIHGTENSFGNIINKINIPVVVSIQGNLTVYHHKYLSGLNVDFIHYKRKNLNIKSLLFGINNFYKGYINLGKMAVIEQKCLRQTKYIIGRTDWDKRITRVLAPNSKYFMGNEILRDGFYENRSNNKALNGKIIIHSTNGNNYYKGFETICYALSLLYDLGLYIEWRVAGISDNSLINKIVRKKLNKYYPKKGLYLLGLLDEEQLIIKLKEANIFVMPSHIENSPNNLCEAMILGIPCISTFAGGTGSLLKDGVEGILIQDGDPWAMAGAILELINDPNRALLFGQAARKRALIRHDKDVILDSLITTYKTIISST